MFASCYYRRYEQDIEITESDTDIEDNRDS